MSGNEPEFQGRLCPHHGKVALDVVDGIACVTHLTTHERITLPADAGSDWSLHFDDHGMAACVRGDGDGAGAVMCLEDIFRQHLHVTEAGEEFIMVDKPHHMKFSLPASQCQHQVGKVMLQVPAPSSLLEFTVYLFKIPRTHGFRLCWSLKCLYSILGLTSYKGVVSRWVSEVLKVWGKYVHTITGGEHFVLSNHGHIAQATVASVPFPQRCLPQAACTTYAFLLVMHRSAYVGAEKGGLSDPAGRSAAQNILKVCITCAVSRLDRVNITLSEQWQCAFPRPQCNDSSTVLLPIRNGQIDCSALFDAATPPNASHVAKKWCKSLHRLVSADTRVIPIADLLASMVVVAVHPFLSQLLFHCARAFEEGLSRVQAGATSSFTEAELVLSKAADIMDDLDKNLMNYVLSSVQESSKARCLFLAVRVSMQLPARTR